MLAIGAFVLLEGNGRITFATGKPWLFYSFTPMAKKSEKLNVLIVEDSPVDQKMITGMLRNSGFGIFEFKICSSLRDSFVQLKKEKFDVVLLDLNLKDSKGLDSLKRIKKKYPDVPIVVHTGAYEDALGLKAVSFGAQDYLIKGKYQSYVLSKSLFYAVERKKVELELQTTLQRLKDTQSQLIQVEKLNVVGELASGIAHEVKNPLATILSGVELLKVRYHTEDKQLNAVLDALKLSAQKANHIIKDLLDFASLSRLKTRNEDLHLIIEQSLLLTEHQCRKRGIVVIKRFAKNFPKIKVDRNRIEQVFVDLILNAILSMRDHGELTISTGVQRLSENDLTKQPQKLSSLSMGDQVVVVDFDDTGTGIPAKHMDKIFDPFFTTRRSKGGVGLGLSVARTIMLNHGGLIYLENLFPKGTRARLIFESGSPANPIRFFSTQRQ